MRINVTKTFLPPLQEYVSYLEEIWSRGQVTNHGPLVTQFERALRDYLGVRHVFAVTNGTIALQIAIKALGLTGEVITTPFSYVATTSSIVWEGAQPIFADIERDTLCIDPDRVEGLLNDSISGIVATHVYGNACNVGKLQEIVARNGLRVIYDAAHAFGSKYAGRSLCSYGDISTLSFHATKLFHTVEGGALVTNDDELAHRIAFMRNFGHNGEEAFWGVGINGKMSELQAAMGLVMLPKVTWLIEQRRARVEAYEDALRGLPLVRPALRGGVEYNYAYYPVLFKDESTLKWVQNYLASRDIYTRRYFYPALSRLSYWRQGACPNAEDAASRVLCLPLHAELTQTEVAAVSANVRAAFADMGAGIG